MTQNSKILARAGVRESEMNKLVVLALFVFFAQYSCQPQKVSVNFYGMSKCPYAAMLVSNFNTNTMLPGIAAITNITFDYIATLDKRAPSGFNSKHGQSEVQGDFYELCTSNEYFSKLWPFLVCAFSNYNEIPSNLNACATQLSLNWAQIQLCYMTKRKELMIDSIVRTNKLQITSSPTLFINGQCVYGALPSCNNMDPQSPMMLQAICAAYTGTKPAACNQ